MVVKNVVHVFRYKGTSIYNKDGLSQVFKLIFVRL